MIGNKRNSSLFSLFKGRLSDFNCCILFLGHGTIKQSLIKDKCHNSEEHAPPHNALFPAVSQLCLSEVISLLASGCVVWDVWFLGCVVWERSHCTTKQLACLR